MGSGGSISQMIKTISFNKSLLSNRRAFGELKEHISRRIENKSGLKIPDIDPEELKKIKQEIRVELASAHKRRIGINVFLVTVGLVILVLGIYYLYSDPLKAHEFTNKLQENERYEKELREEELVKYYILDGNKWLKMNKYHNAIFQFELVLENQLNHYEANIGLTKVLLRQCWLETIDCAKADSQLEFVNEKLEGHRMESKQIISNYLLEIGDTAKAQIVSGIGW